MRRALLAVAVLALARGASASEVGCPAELVVPETTATYYESGSVEGQCSLPTPAGAFYAAVTPEVFGDSQACGRCARVTGPEGSIVVRVVDLCLSAICAAGHLDLLGRDALDAIGDPEQGIIDIAWETIACDVGAESMKIQFEGSNPYYLKAQIQDHRYGIAAVEMLDGPLWVVMNRTLDHHFERTGGGPYAMPFTFRITDVHGQSVVTDPIGELVNDVPLDTGVQLAPCPEPGDALAAIAACAALAVRAQRLRSTASSSAP